MPGQTYVYRFRRRRTPARTGTTPTRSRTSRSSGGLFGALVVLPPRRRDRRPGRRRAVHTYGGTPHAQRRAPGSPRSTPRRASPVRVRVVNTDNGPLRVWVSGAPVPGGRGRRPRPARPAPTSPGKACVVTAGGRVDLRGRPRRPGSTLGGGTALVIGPQGTTCAADPEPDGAGGPAAATARPAPLGVRPGARRPPLRLPRSAAGSGFVDGKPGFWWTINGHLFPDVPMFLVAEGDVVRMTISNHSGEVHPMHLHGHHAVVLSPQRRARDRQPVVGRLARTSPTARRYDIAFVADNPGIWMDHCHNLPHAARRARGPPDVRRGDRALPGRRHRATNEPE